MRIELGTYSTGDKPGHEWECQHCFHCETVKDSSLYVNDMRCGIIKKLCGCTADGCGNFALSNDARELMSDIIKTLQASIESGER